MFELKGERVRHGYTSQELGRMIGVSKQSYGQKERGIRKFTDDEKVKLVSLLGLSYHQFNEIFFDGKLPWTI